jgi:HD superfamily phosphohydrolase
VPYGRNFDRNRLIQSLVLNEAGDGLAITVKGRTAAELMVFARYVMFSEVYWHHAVRSATSMFARGFYELRLRLDLRSFFKQSESETVAALRAEARGTACEPLMEGIFGPKRQLYKRVAEFSLYQGPDVYRRLARRPYPDLVRCASDLAERLSGAIGEHLGPTDVLIDAPPPHREIELNVDIYYAKERVYRPLHQVSPVVETLARTQFDDYVKRVRVFAHPRLARRIASCPSLDELIAEAGAAA